MKNEPYRQISAFFIENSAIIRFLLVIALLVYGLELFGFNQSIDEIITGSRPIRGFIAHGRWGMYLLNVLFLPYSISPIIPLAIALFLTTIALVVFFRILSRPVQQVHYLAAALAISFPTLPYILVFSVNAYGIGFGLLATVLGLQAFVERKRLWFLLPAVCFAFALSIYQSFLLVVVNLFLMFLLNRCVFDRSKTVAWAAKEFLVFAAVVLSSLLIYGSFAALFLYLYQIDLAYVTHFANLDRLLNSAIAVLSRTYQAIEEAYLGRAKYYIDTLYAVPTLLVLSLGAVAYRVVIDRRSPGLMMWIILLIVLAIVSPYSLHLLNGGAMPTRTLLALPFVVSGLIFVGYQASPVWLRYVILPLSIFTVLQFAVVANRHFGATHLALEADRNLGGSIVERVEGLVASSDTKVKYIEISGYHDWPGSPLWHKDNVFGASFFGWVKGDNRRILAFLRSVGLTELSPIPKRKRQELLDSIERLPSWPAPSSVVRIDNVIVVKFGPYSRSQKRLICAGEEVASLCK